MRFSIFFSLLLAVLPTLPATAADPTPPSVFAGGRQAQVAEGVHFDGFLPVGGINQYVSVRGRHTDAPIILFLHGGPGFTSIPTSYVFMAPWEEYFTVAQYDQRGAGKTYGANDPGAVRPTMTMARMLDDAEEMAAWLRKTYGRDKIVLMGHSWGSILGVKLAQRHPDWFYAYVGVGQGSVFGKSEAAGYRATLAAAQKAGNAQAVAELKALAPFPDDAHPERNLQNLGKERRWLAFFHGATWHGTENDYDNIGQLNPDITAKDWDDRNKGLDFSLGVLWPEVEALDFSAITDFRCPVFLFEGRHDLNVNADLAAQWFQTIKAPQKKLIWFEDSGHQVFEEEPGKTLVTLVDQVLPLTRASHR
jgi:proline iminopeptidase